MLHRQILALCLAKRGSLSVGQTGHWKACPLVVGPGWVRLAPCRKGLEPQLPPLRDARRGRGWTAAGGGGRGGDDGDDGLVAEMSGDGGNARAMTGVSREMALSTTSGCRIRPVCRLASLGRQSGSKAIMQYRVAVQAAFR